MGFLKNLFSGKTPGSVLHWQPLSATEQLADIKALSEQKTVLIFKHSTRCGISSMVLRQFEGAFSPDNSNVELYFIDLLAHRPVSNAVADYFGVEHQSPQLLVIENGVCVKHASHYGIMGLV